MHLFIPSAHCVLVHHFNISHTKWLEQAIQVILQVHNKETLINIAFSITQMRDKAGHSEENTQC